VEEIRHFIIDLWRWAVAHWEWIIGTIVIGGIRLYLAWVQIRHSRISQRVNFKNAVGKGHNLRERFEAGSGQSGREELLREAMNCYEEAREWALSKKERAQVFFYLGICAEMQREPWEADSCFQQGVKMNRRGMVDTAISQAKKYSQSYNRSDYKSQQYEYLTRICYKLARDWERRKRRKAEICFEYGRWLVDFAHDPHEAREQFQLCTNLRRNYHREFPRALYYEALVDIDLGDSISAEKKLELYLMKEPNNEDAKALLELVQEQVKAPQLEISQI